MNIYISPSTQEKNIGYGEYTTEEKRMNELADIIIPMLVYNGFNVFRNSPSMSLLEVCKDSNNKLRGNGVHIALHSNAGGGKGTEIWHYPTSEKGKKLAHAIYNEVAPLTPSNDRGVKTTNKFMELKVVVVPSVILETLFHDNKEDAEWLMQHMKETATAIVKGICKYHGVPFKEKNELPKKDVYYQVVTGSFNDQENAEKRVKDLLLKGFSSFVQIKER